MSLDPVRRDDIVQVLTRIPISRGQLALLKALVEADGWVAGRPISRRLYPDSALRQWHGMLNTFARKINQTHREAPGKPGITLILEKRKDDAGEWVYRARPELEAAIGEIEGLAAHLARPWDALIAAGEADFGGDRSDAGERGEPEALWRHIAAKAERLGVPARLRIRWRIDNHTSHEALLIISASAGRVRVAQKTIDALRAIDLEELSSGGAFADALRTKRKRLTSASELTPNAASTYIFGPIFHKDRTTHQYSAWDGLYAHPEDVARFFADLDTLDSPTDWLALATLRDAVGRAEASQPDAVIEADGDDDSSEASLEALPAVADLPAVWATHHSTLEGHLEWDLGLLMATQGGWALLEESPLEFDFREEYWRLPERRTLVAYFADRFSGGFAPAEAMRAHASAVVRHFDAPRAAARFRWHGVEYPAMGGWQSICDALIEHARSLPDSEAWHHLQHVWNLDAPDAAAHLIDFLEDLRDEDGPQARERSFSQRLPWLAFLGDPARADLRGWQDFFFAYFTTLMSTNAYRHAGAVSYASILQNTPTPVMRGNLARWLAEGPARISFETLNRDDTAVVDRAGASTVVESLGLLQLERVPLVNNVSRQHLARGEHDPAASYALMAAVGAETHAALRTRPTVTTRLAALFREWISTHDAHSRVEMETVRTQRAARRAEQAPEALVTPDQHGALTRAARARLDRLDDVSAAACATHILYDLCIWEDVSIEVDPEAPTPGATPSLPAPVKRLPEPLRAIGERALAYLRAGLHVLLAGAPGTGKTTLAQFVAAAWNQGRDQLPDALPLDKMPVTVVAHSAWTPFHTIGGLVPREEGGFRTVPGVFIDHARTQTGTWYLRPACMVLDEFNRADLDRCIGDLYPLLSDTVPQVEPAGIIGLKAIRLDKRFRLIATVNDATLDDVVFPMSEGLARRFQRIEMPGASRDDLRAFLFGQERAHLDPARIRGAEEVLSAIFDSDNDDHFLLSGGDEDRLPFGAGYFKLARRWLEGELTLPIDEGTEPSAQAAVVFRAALSTAVRIPRYEKALARRLRDLT